jgi:hypothetical protein
MNKSAPQQMTEMTDAEIQRAYEKEAEILPRSTGKMSELCKYAWAGSMAVMFTLLTAEEKTRAAEFLTKNRYFMIGAAVCGSVAFVLDYLQNLAAYKHSRNIVDWIEARTTFTREDYNQQTQGFWLSTSKVLFFVKNCFAVASAVLLGLSVLDFLFP